MSRTVAVVTLGCARNEVDSEELAGRLAADGWTLVDDVEKAEVALVITKTSRHVCNLLFLEILIRHMFREIADHYFQLLPSKERLSAMKSTHPKWAQEALSFVNVWEMHHGRH
jgi:hypothetical protein